jgi:hypothetical protein
MRNYFISEQAIKDTTVLNENVDPKLIAPGIIEAQDIHIQEILGSQLYDKIDSLIPSGNISLPANAVYKTLLDSYIKPALKYYTLAELVLPMSIKLMNKSVATRSSDNAQPLSPDDFGLVRETFMNKAQFYGTRLINYLIDNRTSYPEYLDTPTTDIYSRITPKSNAYKTAMYLGGDDCNTCLPEFNKRWIRNI